MVCMYKQDRNMDRWVRNENVEKEIDKIPRRDEKASSTYVHGGIAEKRD